MGKALYRKYRSKRLSEIIGQEHITDSLDNALRSGKISHAYLFTGPRGVGKTSIARILAHEINDIPYTDDSFHMDIIEIDAASNRRIDEIRELRDKVHVAPTSAPFKVYIIDEVHMLTKEAFNALLKTLEEPPAHVIFILATTDVHKLPETIVSRTQRFSFRPVERDKVIAHLKTIAEQESIHIDDEALGLLADHGEGSFRDSISLLDQASNRSDKITIDDVQQLLGIPPKAAIEQLANLLQGPAEARQVALDLAALNEQGYQAPAIAKQLGQILRDRLLGGTVQAQPTLQLLDQLLTVPSAHDPSRYLEICLLGALELLPTTLKEAAVSEVATASSKISAVDNTSEETKSKQPTLPDAPPPSAVAKPTRSTGGTAAIDDTLWAAILEALKSKYNTLYGVVRMAHPTFGDTSLELAFAFAFHQKRISDAKNQKIISDVIEQLSGKKLAIHCVLDKQLAHQPLPTIATGKAQPKSTPPDLSAINSIFGGGELLND